ncbi:hypothetical protein AB0F43_14635 [Kribbella sp. NPDC023972]|uniref:hypothetical protein n=1 Tax=Kribbella sp. NPDC023972 TaxID=3154795 RepID=UPI00340A0E71
MSPVLGDLSCITVILLRGESRAGGHMAVMGEEQPEVWTAELQRSGRVLFPVRRRPVLIRSVLFGIVFGANLADSLIDDLNAGGARRVMTLLGLAVVLMIVGLCFWQVTTRRPILIVDREGIRLGRKRFMPWTDVGTIGIPTGPKFFMNVPVLPANVWAKELRLSQDNVKDIPAFAHWLEDVLKEQRRLTTPPGQQP